MVKIGLSYTGFTPSLMEIVESAIRDALPNEDIQFVTIANPLLIHETIQAGEVTPGAARGLMRAYMGLIDAGVDLIVSVCSTMGDVAELVKPAMRAMRVPFIRVDEAMAKDAVSRYGRVAVIYGSKPVMGPNRRLIEKAATETNSTAAVSHILLENVAGPSRQHFIDAVAAAVAAEKEKPEVIVLTQTSMTPAVPELEKALGIKVISSAPFAADAVAGQVRAMKEKGELR